MDKFAFCFDDFWRLVYIVSCDDFERMKPHSVVDLPIPTAHSGEAVIKVLAAPILRYTHLIHSGILPLNLQPPFVPNASAVGRIHAVGPDAVSLKEGDLVYVDSSFRARDDPENVRIMLGHHGGEGPAGRKLTKEWRDGSLQQYQRVPLENIYLMDEKTLFGKLGYDAATLIPIAFYGVAAGGILETADVKVGETVIVGPATGTFAGLAVELALIAGANVIGLGRNQAKLEAMEQNINNCRFSTVLMTGDEEVDVAAILKLTPGGRGADVFNDWTTSELETPPYLETAVRALKMEGRVVLSGAPMGKLTISYGVFIEKNLKMLGKWTLGRRTQIQVIKMITQGQLRIGRDTGTEVKVFGMDELDEAVTHSAENSGFRNYTVVAPNLDV